MGYEFDWVAAFSTEPFGGNGCVVVHDAEPLGQETRFKITRETSLVECTFVEKSDVADFKFRIYMADKELPFAGHPTLAGVASLRHRGLISGGSVTIETGAGLIPIEISPDGLITMTQIAPSFGPLVDPALVAASVGLDVDDIAHPPQVVSTGLPFVITVLKSREALERAQLDAQNLVEMHASIDLPNTEFMEPFLVVPQGATDAGDTFSRLLLAPPLPPEDAFTGSATGAMASFMFAKGLLPAAFIAQQGHTMGRPGQASVQVLGTPENIMGVRLSGHAHITMSGQFFAD